MKKSFFNEYFSFSASEKRSVLIVSILILIALVISVIIKYFPREKKQFSKEELNEIYELAEELSRSKECKEYSDSLDPETRILFPFDPNTASKQDLEKLGFTSRQIQTIQNYLKAGGIFYHKKDLKKIYNINEEEYLIFEPYIKIESSDQISDEKIGIISSSDKLNSPDETSGDEPGKVEINTAKFNELILIKGVGEVYANRIIKYRDLLGGYCNQEQLLEVYGINDTVLSQIAPQIEIDTFFIKTIDLNAATYKDLIRHPYLDPYHTKAILTYREYKKKQISKEDLIRDNILPKEIYDRFSRYLKP